MTGRMFTVLIVMVDRDVEQHWTDRERPDDFGYILLPWWCLEGAKEDHPRNICLIFHLFLFHDRAV
jgi:hypothetical protein